MLLLIFFLFQKIKFYWNKSLQMQYFPNIQFSTMYHKTCKSEKFIHHRELSNRVAFLELITKKRKEKMGII